MRIWICIDIICKNKSGYMVIFNIPFSGKSRLPISFRSIVLKLRENDVKKILHWDGSPDKIKLDLQ